MVKKIFPESSFKISTRKGDMSKRWFVWYKAIDGKLVRIYDGINQHQTPEARYEECKRIVDDLKKIFPNAGKPKLVIDLFRYVQSKKTARKKTIQSYESRINLFAKYYIGGAFGIKEAEGFLDWMIESGKSPTYRNNLREFFISAFKWLIKKGYYKRENPFKATEKIFARSTPARYFQIRHVKRLSRLIQSQDPELWLFCQFIYYCFIRPGELRDVKVSDILWEEKRIIMRNDVSKNNRQQYVHIPKAFFPIIEEHFGDAHLSYYLFSNTGGPGPTRIGTNEMGNRHRPILRSAGLGKGFVLYSWKHTGAAAFIRNGGHIKALQLQLRHYSLDQTDTYISQLGFSDMPGIDNFPEIGT